jgi:hypothetical protein
MEPECGTEQRRAAASAAARGGPGRSGAGSPNSSRVTGKFRFEVALPVAGSGRSLSFKLSCNLSPSRDTQSVAWC